MGGGLVLATEIGCHGQEVSGLYTSIWCPIMDLSSYQGSLYSSHQNIVRDLSRIGRMSSS
jgi:hypothetical protein